jgi:hypothetical protein
MADDKKNPFLHALNGVIGDTPQEEGVTPSMSPIDFIAPSMAGAMVEAAPRILGNEIGAAGPGVAQLIAKEAAGVPLNMAEQVQLAAARSSVQGPAGGLTNGVAMQQAGTPFQAAAAQNANLWQQATKTPARYADGGEIAPNTIQAPLLTGEQRLAQEAAAQAPSPIATPPPPATPSNQVNMFNPHGDLVSVPAHQAKAAEGEGYRPASDEEVHKHVMDDKYGGTGQQIIAGLEGVGQGLAGPLSTGAEVALGVNKEDILGREEANPGTNMLGQTAGLVGGAFLGTTEARAIPTLAGVAEKLGAAGAAKLLPGAAMEGAGAFAKIGSAAVRGAIDNMVVQSSNEATHMVLQDPAQSVQTALVDVGLAGLIGGGISGTIGAVSPLWKATMGKKTDGLLSAISNKMGGIEGVNADVIDDAITAAGLPEDAVTPEIRASLSQNPAVRNSAQILMDSASDSGLKYQEALKSFRNNLNEHALEIMGRTPSDLEHLVNLDTHQAGNNIRGMIRSEIEPLHKVIGADYDAIAERFKKVDLASDVKTQLSEDVAKTLGEGVSPESPAAKLVTRVMKEVPALENLEQLRNYTSELMREVNHFTKPEYGGVAPAIRQALMGAEENALNRAVERDAPELLAKHLEANKSYKAFMSTINELDDRLNVGSFRGAKGFLRALDNMDPETIVSRLNPSNKAGIIDELSRSFPAVAKELQDYHLSKLVRQAAQRSQKLGYEGLDVKELNKLLTSDKMSPQMRSFLVSPEAQGRLQALQALIEHLPEKIGKSGTPQGLDGLLKYLPASAVGLATMLGSHNLLTAGLMGSLTKVLSRDAPDAARLAMLKFLGSSKNIEPTAFKAAVDYIESALRGDKAISKATASVFRAGREVLPQALIPKAKDREKLDKQLQSLQGKPDGLLKVGGAATHYMDDHGEHMGATAANAVGYLNSMRPNQTPTSPLGKPLPVDPVKKAQYDRALSIAQQPLTVLDRLQKGTILPSDVVALKTMYPSLYTKFVTQLTDHMTQQLARGEPIPYTTRLGLSVFMAQPLDGTMTPAAIMAAQAPQMAAQQQKQMNGSPDTLRPSQAGMNGLAKIPQSYQTPNQARAAARAKPSH